MSYPLAILTVIVAFAIGYFIGRTETELRFAHLLRKNRRLLEERDRLLADVSQLRRGVVQAMVAGRTIGRA